MNFVAHVAVARLVEPGDTDLALGAALPDLSAMSAMALRRDRLTPAQRSGIALHHRTDRTFHADPRFREGSAGLRRRLAAAGLPTGAVRGVGHAGWELLLDGCLLERPGVADQLVEVLLGAPALAQAVDEAADRSRWRTLAASMVTERWWMAYRSPQFVAERLQRRLSRRPRLAFAPAQIPAVTEALAAVRGDVDRVADEVVRSVTTALSQTDLSERTTLSERTGRSDRPVAVAAAQPKRAKGEA